MPANPAARWMASPAQLAESSYKQRNPIFKNRARFDGRHASLLLVFMFDTSRVKDRKPTENWRHDRLAIDGHGFTPITRIGRRCFPA